MLIIPNFGRLPGTRSRASDDQGNVEAAGRSSAR